MRRRRNCPACERPLASDDWCWGCRAYRFPDDEVASNERAWSYEQAVMKEHEA